MASVILLCILSTEANKKGRERTEIRSSLWQTEGIPPSHHHYKHQHLILMHLHHHHHHHNHYVLSFSYSSYFEAQPEFHTSYLTFFQSLEVTGSSILSSNIEKVMQPFNVLEHRHKMNTNTTRCTLPKTNSSPLKIGFPKRRLNLPTVVFQGLC